MHRDNLMHMKYKTVRESTEDIQTHAEGRAVSHTITIDRSAYDDTAKMDTTASRHIATQQTHTQEQFIASKKETSWDLTWAGGFHLIGCHMHSGYRDNGCPCRIVAARAQRGTEP